MPVNYNMLRNQHIITLHTEHVVYALSIGSLNQYNRVNYIMIYICACLISIGYALLYKDGYALYIYI